MLPWLLRSRMLRRPVALMGAACTSVLLGMFIFNKVLINKATNCVVTCKTSTAYEHLQRNEMSRRMRHPMIKSFDVNYLGSNSPIEDRFVIGSSPKLGVALFSIIDGHKGSHCSHFLQSHIFRYIYSAFHNKLHLPFKSDLQTILDMNFSISNAYESWDDKASKVTLDHSLIKECLSEAYVTLDSDISNIALSDIKMVLQGHSFTSEMKERVLTAIEGACAITALVHQKNVMVANTGDCRVVIGHKLPDNEWQAIPLSQDHNVHNEAEVERLKSSHPGEERTVIIQDRVLGSLMPFRTFGDVDFKWERKYLESIVQVWPNYYTPPYVIAEPVVTGHEIEAGDKFMILASDGLWERISNEDAVNFVVKSLQGAAQNSDSWFKKLGAKNSKCCMENVATQLLWHALGGTDESVTELLNLHPKVSRMFRDDITVIVAFFRND